MSPFLSEGDFWGDLRISLVLLFPPSRSLIPTVLIGFWPFDSDGFLLSQLFYDSFTFPSLSRENCKGKPPWINCFIYVGIFNISSSSDTFYFSKQFLVNTESKIMSDNIQKSLQDLNLGINDIPISLPSELCGRAAALNRLSLIVSVVNSRKQNLRAIASQMPRIWGFADGCRGRILGNGKVLFIFQSEESMNLVLRRGPWAFNDWMLSVHRWYPNITEEEMKIIPFWIQIRGIPVLYLTNAMVRYIGTQMGFVADVDFDETAGWAEFARVCVNWNYDMPLRFQRNFQFSVDENTVLKFRFERLRNFCTRCGSLKHDVKECTLHYDDPPMDNSDDDNDHDVHNPQEEKAPETEDTLQTIAPDGEIPGLQRSNRHT